MDDVSWCLVKLARDLTRFPIYPQKVAFWKRNGTPAISGKSRLVKYYNLARMIWVGDVKLKGCLKADEDITYAWQQDEQTWRS